MSRCVQHEAPTGPDRSRKGLLMDMEAELSRAEDLASVVWMAFHSGAEFGELSVRRCHGGMQVAMQLEERIAEMTRVFEAIRDTWLAEDRGGA